jgi:hypothetical protein
MIFLIKGRFPAVCFAGRRSFPGSLLAMLLVSLSITASGRAGADVAEQLLVAGFPDARVVYDSSGFEHDYRLTLGAMKKANNKWFAEREQRLSGPLHKQTLELAEGYGAEEAYSYYRNQLLGLGGRELFRCASRNCGSSSSWANERFKVSQLYGLDPQQLFSAFEVPGAAAQDNYYVVIYAVTRGNRRSYVQYEQILSAASVAVAASPAAIAEALQTGRSYRLPPQYDADGRVLVAAEQVQSLAEALRLQPGLRVVLVGHNFDAVPLTEQRQRAEAAARELRAQLEAGMAGERVQVQGIGSLAPGARGDRSNRIEVVRAP